MEKPGKLAAVFSGRIAEADLVKFALEEAGIACWYDSDAGAQVVRVLVAAPDAERAKAEIKRSREEETTSD
jgi:hypothetical protein